MLDLPSSPLTSGWLRPWFWWPFLWPYQKSIRWPRDLSETRHSGNEQCAINNSYAHLVGSYPYNRSHPIRKGSTEVIHDFSWHDSWHRLSPGRKSGRLSSLAKVVTCGRIAFDVFLMCQGGVCAISSTYCGDRISALGQVERSIQKLKKKATWLSWFNLDGLWD